MNECVDGFLHGIIFRNITLRYHLCSSTFLADKSYFCFWRVSICHPLLAWARLENMEFFHFRPFVEAVIIEHQTIASQTIHQLLYDSWIFPWSKMSANLLTLLANSDHVKKRQKGGGKVMNMRRNGAESRWTAICYFSLLKLLYIEFVFDKECGLWIQGLKAREKEP